VELLAEAGYPGGKGLPEIEIASASSSDFAKNELSLFAEDMAALGVRIKPIFVDGWDAFTQGLDEGRYSIYRYALFADIPDPDDLLATLFKSGSKTNYTGWSDPEVDSLFDQAKGETDPVKRVTLYRQAEKKVLEQVPVIPVLFLTTQVSFQGYVKGIDLPATGTTNLPLHRVSLDR
jgi:ABC-type transport system substrate-binding protein